MKAVIVMVVTLLSQAAAQSVHSDDCVSDFKKVGSACYNIPDLALDWYNAMDHCRSLSLPNGKTAALARVENCSQLHLLWEFIKHEKYPIVDYWLGGTTNLDSSGAFRWDSTGELVPMGVPLWFPGQPDLPLIESSLSLSKNGFFADEEQHLLQRFICQLL